MIFFRLAKLSNVLSLIFLLIFFIGCNKTGVGPETSQKLSKEISVTDYSERYYFLDTLYRKFFEHLHESPVPTITPDIEFNRILDSSVDVWVSTKILPIDSTARRVQAFIDLYSLPQDSTHYPDSLHQNVVNPIIGRIEIGYFAKLSRDQFTYDPFSGFIALAKDVGNDRAVAVAYKTVGGQQYGEYTTASVSDTTVFVLKLVKPKNLFPADKPAWDLMLKNVYSFGISNLKQDSFELRIFYKPIGQRDTDSILGKNLLQVLGLDKYDHNYIPNPDGKFDYIPYLTVNPVFGDIIFPTLRPFDSTIVQYFRSLEPPVTIDDTLLNHLIYDTTRTAAQQNFINGSYLLYGIFN